ncbi:hypothetical protein SAMN06264364_101234 [Quadrisphaera granulorum]|uniref:Uncharacterized protein n=1 Tax=Quadrisphaera granulorum TaxID=317664 RepID=A0A316AFX8_9ACTN|nr:hypothetical protein BXY45_101234 [Quadrisphaera granulorum]SZE94893.1 hypothetical protein SAMN06264364_101234 [Quadrisphaera granulorum]
MVAVERQLQRSLGAWVGVSTVGGAAAIAVGRSRKDPLLRAFGLQTLLWAAADAGVLAASTRGNTPPAGRLRALLIANAAADVAYVGIGSALAARPDRVPQRLRGLGRQERRRTSDAAVRGHGLAVVVQGLALLVIDSTAAARLRPPRP